MPEDYPEIAGPKGLCSKHIFPLLAAARAKGCRTIDGVEMLVAQAVGQFEAWAGAPAPVEAMTDAALAAIAEARA